MRIVINSIPVSFGTALGHCHCSSSDLQNACLYDCTVNYKTFFYSCFSILIMHQMFLKAEVGLFELFFSAFFFFFLPKLMSVHFRWLCRMLKIHNDGIIARRMCLWSRSGYSTAQAMHTKQTGAVQVRQQLLLLIFPFKLIEVCLSWITEKNKRKVKLVR